MKNETMMPALATIVQHDIECSGQTNQIKIQKLKRNKGHTK